jgi:hypothetical protein
MLGFPLLPELLRLFQVLPLLLNESVPYHHHSLLLILLIHVGVDQTRCVKIPKLLQQPIMDNFLLGRMEFVQLLHKVLFVGLVELLL